MLLRLLLVGLCAVWATPAASPGPLFFFGDSLTDTGNVYAATVALNRYTFGVVPIYPSAPYAGGRFSNGPVWAEHVAASLGRAEDAQPAGMSLGWLGNVEGPGNNYAIGGARTGDGGALGSLNTALPTGIDTQVEFYLSRTGGVADPAALYLILGGGNDLRAAARLADPDQRMQAAVGAGINIAYSVQRLYFAGARRFVLINAPDVGLIPESLADGVSAQGTEVSRAFNSWLAEYAAYLQTVPELSLVYFDLSALHHELVQTYGLEAVRPCIDGPAAACEQTLFFDSIHPNARVHAIIGERLAARLSAGSSPRLMAFACTPSPASGSWRGWALAPRRD